MNNELRCEKCGKKLGADLEGIVKIVCPKCKHYNCFIQRQLTAELKCGNVIRKN